MKKNFREFVIDTIQRKRQVANKVGGVNAIKIQEDMDKEVAIVGVRNINEDINQNKDRSCYTRAHWARSTIET